MNDAIYEEYMRSVLGYRPVNRNTYDMYYENYEMPDMTAMNNLQIQELEECYPDIYRIIYPMVQKACSQNTKPITRELVNNMTDEIYFSIEDREMKENRKNEEEESRQSAFGNPTARDIISILLLRELLGTPRFPGRPSHPRPPYPPMRPPMGPPRPQPRPGMRSFNRNAIDEYFDLYEY